MCVYIPNISNNIDIETGWQRGHEPSEEEFGQKDREHKATRKIKGAKDYNWREIIRFVVYTSC